jgi:DNA-directed RNA polymerase specialized sigma24 family protein
MKFQPCNHVTDNTLRERILKNWNILKMKTGIDIILKDISGYTMQEVSRFMGITVSAAKTLHTEP